MSIEYAIGVVLSYLLRPFVLFVTSDIVFALVISTALVVALGSIQWSKSIVKAFAILIVSYSAIALLLYAILVRDLSNDDFFGALKAGTISGSTSLSIVWLSGLATPRVVRELHQ